MTYTLFYPSCANVFNMSGLDTLIAKSLENTLKESLGEQTFQKIQRRIIEKHGIGFTKAIEDFQKFDSVLRELFGSSAEGIERQILDKIVILEETKRKERTWITIEDRALLIASGFSCWKTLRPNDSPAAPAFMELSASSNTSKSVFILGPPATTTGTGQPRTTL